MPRILSMHLCFIQTAILNLYTSIFKEHNEIYSVTTIANYRKHHFYQTEEIQKLVFKLKLNHLVKRTKLFYH